MSPSFVALHFLVTEIAKCICCLLFFYNNYIVYNNVYCYYCSVLTESICFVFIGCCAHLYP